MGIGSWKKSSTLLFVGEAVVALAIIACLLWWGPFLDKAVHFSSFVALYNMIAGIPFYVFGDPHVLADFFDIALAFFAAALILLVVWLVGRGAGRFSFIQKSKAFVRAHKSVVYLSLLLVVALLSRILLLNDGLFHHDTIGLADTVHAVEKDHVLHPVISGRFGFVLANVAYYYALRNFAPFLEYDTALNLITALFASLSVVWVFLLIRFWRGDDDALWGSLFYLAMPVVWSTGTFAKEHGVSLFFTLMGLYCFLAARASVSSALSSAPSSRSSSASYSNFSNSSISSSALRFSSRVWYLLGGIALVVAMHVRLTNVFVLLPLLFFLLFEGKILRQARRAPARGMQKWNYDLLWFFVPIALSVLEIVLFEWHYVVYESEYNQIRWQYPLLILHRLYISWMYNLRNFTLLGILLAAGGVFYLLLRKRFYLLLFYLLWLLPTFFYIGATSYPSARHFEMMFVPGIILMLCALEPVRLRRPSQASLLALMALLLMALAIFPILMYRHGYSGPKEYVRYLDSISDPDSVFIALDDHVFITYYSGKQFMAVPYKGSREEIAQSLVDIRAALFDGRRVFISDKVLNWPNQNVISNNLNGNFRIRRVGQVVSEDYHNAEILMSLYQDPVYELLLKSNNTDESLMVFVSQNTGSR